MLRDVLENYLDQLSEREFDAPFLAILRSLGFFDIHPLHGQFEFGKDFIAKREENGEVKQYSLQSKAGDLDLRKWRELRNQLEEIRTTVLSHPNFDQALPRRTVLVTTGRLIGEAPLSAQQYGHYVEGKGDGTFETWERDRLAEYIEDSPAVGLAGQMPDELLGLIGSIGAGSTTTREIERFSRRWLDNHRPLESSVVECLVLASRLRERNRLDLAAYATLCLGRSTAARWHADRAEDDFLDLAPRAFVHYATLLWERCGAEALDAEELADSGEFSSFATYPVRCLRIAEILALLAFWLLRESDPRSRDVVNYLLVLAKSNPGLAHPISDNWAISLVLVGAVLGKRDERLTERWLREVTKWIADHYDQAPGLAGIDSDETTELEWLLGRATNGSSDGARPSLLATAVLDIEAILEIQAAYDTSRHEFLAVDIHQQVVEFVDNLGQYQRDGDGVAQSADNTYEDSWNPSDEWKVAAHHRRARPTALELSGREWQQLAISLVLRDRWSLTALRALALSMTADS